MSRVCITTTTSGRVVWCRNSAIFTTDRFDYGLLSMRRGRLFGASWASAVLGPDLAMPGQMLPSPPNATGAIWDALAGAGRPLVTFATDDTYDWVRGHLINGSWGGPGNVWENLTPLTAIANSNHETVENFINGFITASRAYEEADYRTSWYGVYYCVQCSVDPFSDPTSTSDTNLYSYVPAFIKVSWRAISILKPTNQSASTVRHNLRTLQINAVPPAGLPFTAPARPTVMVNTAVLPAVGNAGGGLVLGQLPADFPAVQANTFDGEIEIHQT